MGADVGSSEPPDGSTVTANVVAAPISAMVCDDEPPSSSNPTDRETPSTSHNSYTDPSGGGAIPSNRTSAELSIREYYTVAVPPPSTLTVTVRWSEA